MRAAPDFWALAAKRLKLDHIAVEDLTDDQVDLIILCEEEERQAWGEAMADAEDYELETRPQLRL